MFPYLGVFLLLDSIYCHNTRIWLIRLINHKGGFRIEPTKVYISAEPHSRNANVQYLYKPLTISWLLGKLCPDRTIEENQDLPKSKFVQQKDKK